MDMEKQVDVVNICIVNALRLDEDHRMMIIEKLTQNLTYENRHKLLILLDVDSQAEQLCQCHDPMTQTNVITGELECYYCGGKR